ncbi:cyclophilin-like fold protein [Spirochaetota bacterium]
MKKIKLDFDDFILTAKLFDINTAKSLVEILPCKIELIKWGDELYGPLDLNVKEESLIPNIPEGGIAYTNRGNYLCIFYGQTPAWPVEHIGEIEGDSWKKLRGKPCLASVKISLDLNE